MPLGPAFLLVHRLAPQFPDWSYPYGPCRAVDAEPLVLCNVIRQEYRFQ